MIHLEARDELFRNAAAGSPFVVYARHDFDKVSTRNYAVAAGDKLIDSWPLRYFVDGRYQFDVYGPNGFYRVFRGDAAIPSLQIQLQYARSADRTLSGDVEILASNLGNDSHIIEVTDLSYKNAEQRLMLGPGEKISCVINAQRSFGWYDLRVRIPGVDAFLKRYAGRVETGAWSFSDPVLGAVGQV
jgi:phospholipase C